MVSEPKFPHIHVKLVGEDGNAFFILGRVRKAMQRGGCTTEEIKTFSDAATASDYDHLLRTVMETVSTDDLDAFDDWDGSGDLFYIEEG